MGTMGGGDDNVRKFPNRAARWRNSAGFDRRRTNNPATTAENAPSDEVAPEPLTKEERLGIAHEMKEDLPPLALGNQEWGITEEMIEEKVSLLLAIADGSTETLIPYLEEAARRDISQTKADIVLHLAAARAYLDILELNEREKTV